MKTTLNLSKSYPSTSYYAKRLWEALFRTVSAEKFADLHPFLCDLRTFEEFITDKENEFYWAWDISGWTKVTLYNPHECNTFKITIKRDAAGVNVDSITIEEAEINPIYI
jgi:hypothetical protein